MSETKTRIIQERTHSFDCYWWSYKICDCGYLLRAHSRSEPSEQVLTDWVIHLKRIEESSSLVHDQLTDRLERLDNRIHALEKELAVYKEAVKVLDGRLGDGDKEVVWACEEYVKTEDVLPECFDGEAYRLSKAVGSLVRELEQSNTELDAWKSTFGTTQLTHALARLQAAEVDLKFHKQSLTAHQNALKDCRVTLEGIRRHNHLMPCSCGCGIQLNNAICAINAL